MVGETRKDPPKKVFIRPRNSSIMELGRFRTSWEETISNPLRPERVNLYGTASFGGPSSYCLFGVMELVGSEGGCIGGEAGMSEDAGIGEESPQERETMLFGEFLVRRGAVTEEEMLKALDEQKKRRLPLGTVAIMENFLTFKDVYTVLNAQVEQPAKRFGEVALELGLLTPETLENLLALQREKNPHVGEVLVELGLLDRERLLSELNVYLRLAEAGLDAEPPPAG